MALRESPQQSQNLLSFFLTTTQGSTILGALIISIAILLSGGVIKIKGISPNTNSPSLAALASSPPTQENFPQPAEDTSPKQVSIDDDPVLGDPDAPVTLIEFSDYECPFCKRHFEQTLPQLKKDYIETGKVKLVFRDFPLSFHDPLATTEAMAANCAREQGGDATYFKFHDEIFIRTTSNGNGLSKDQLYTISTELGLNTDNLKSCVEAEKYKDEVSKDLADGSAAGVSGTPGFLIGKSTENGTIEGAPLFGAQPYSAFKVIIDQLLAN